MSLNGFLYPIFFVFNYLHIFSYPDAFVNAQNVKNSLEIFMPLSPDITMNAYVTLFYYFYIDFEGNMHEERIQRAINKMKANSTTLKVLGNYKRA